MEKALYYETYPLGITALSKVATFTALLVGTWATFEIHWAFGMGYLISYFLLMAYQIKYRKFRCQYYGKTIHSRFGKILENLPPDLDEEKLKESTSDLIILSVFAYVVILAPIIAAIVGMIQIVQNVGEAEGLIAAVVFVAVYTFAIIYPSFILKKEIFPAFCVDDSEAEGFLRPKVTLNRNRIMKVQTEIDEGLRNFLKVYLNETSISEDMEKNIATLAEELSKKTEKIYKK